jgi:hypothetical protein
MYPVELKVPGFNDYIVTFEGEVISYKCGKRIKRKLPKEARKKITLKDASKARHYIKVHKIVASAKYGRAIQEFEVVRHKNGNAADNSVMNLELGDGILNAIDDYMYGDKVTTVEYIDQAIDLLMALREKMGG